MKRKILCCFLSFVPSHECGLSTAQPLPDELPEIMLSMENDFDLEIRLAEGLQSRLDERASVRNVICLDGQCDIVIDLVSYPMRVTKQIKRFLVEDGMRLESIEPDNTDGSLLVSASIMKPSEPKRRQHPEATVAGKPQKP